MVGLDLPVGPDALGAHVDRGLLPSRANALRMDLVLRAVLRPAIRR